MSKTRESAARPGRSGRLNEDHWKPGGNKANGDHRPYVTTNKGTAPGLPQEDEYNPGVVWWFSKRIWLGHKPKARYLAGRTPPKKTRLWKLFDVLAYSPDRWHSVSKIHERVFGKGLDGMSRAERKRTVLRVRRLVSKLKRRMGQYGADEHAIIVAKSYNRRPSYMALLLSNQKYEEGREPWPELGRDDRQDRPILKEERRENGEPCGMCVLGRQVDSPGRDNALAETVSPSGRPTRLLASGLRNRRVPVRDELRHEHRGVRGRDEQDATEHPPVDLPTQ